MKRTSRKRVKKVCAKCGTVVLALPRERKCKHQGFGPQSYLCWGSLRVVDTPSPPAPDPRVVLAQRAAAYRARAVRAMATAEAKIATYRRRETQSAELVEKWTRRLAREEKRAQITDEALEALRQRALTAQQVYRATQRLKKSAGIA